MGVLSVLSGRSFVVAPLSETRLSRDPFLQSTRTFLCVCEITDVKLLDYPKGVSRKTVGKDVFRDHSSRLV